MSLDKYFLDLKEYKIIRILGSGSFGKVQLIKKLSNNNLYAAKTLKHSINLDSKMLFSLYKEIKIMEALNHPSIIRFYGCSKTDFKNYPRPTIITEYAPNGTLKDIIEYEQSSNSHKYWDDTKKLICIYGIASGMSYLHRNNIVHRDLKTENILMDEYLLPKISDFGLSKVNSTEISSWNVDSIPGLKGTPKYMAPELFNEGKYSESTDVYAFSIVAYEIVTANEAFQNLNFFTLITKVRSNERPDLSGIQQPMRSLIQRCWSQNPLERPKFDQIVNELKDNHDFITDLVDESEFIKYVDFVDNYESTFIINKNIHFNDLTKSNKQRFSRMSIKIEKNKIVEIIPEKITEIEEQDDVNNDIDDKNEENNNSDDNKDENNNSDDNMNDENKNGNDNNDNDSLYPFDDLMSLDSNCKSLVNDAENDPKKKFIVGKSLIEGKLGFPKNTQLGIKYMKKSQTIDSKIYLAKMYIEGEVVPEDISESKRIISEVDSKEDDPTCLYVLGRICKKEKKYQNAFEFFEKSSKLGNPDSMFYCSKMLNKGYEGVVQDQKKSKKYFELSQKNGCKFNQSNDSQQNEQQSIKLDQNESNLNYSQKKEPKSIKLDQNESNFNIKNSNKPSKKIKIVCCGDYSAGKIKLLYKITKGDLPPEYVPTVFDNYIVKRNYKGENYIIQLWDTAGQQELENIRVLSYQNTDIFFLVFSLTDKASLLNVYDKWYKEISYYNFNQAIFFLIGTNLEEWKTNPNKYEIFDDDINDVAKKVNAAAVIQLSYTTGENFEELSFDNIIRIYLSQRKALKKNGNKNCFIF